MYSALIHSHSGLRWILLILLVATIFTVAGKRDGKTPLTAQDKKLSLFTLIATHLQAVLGLGLYFMSQKVAFAGDIGASGGAHGIRTARRHAACAGCWIRCPHDQTRGLRTRARGAERLN